MASLTNNLATHYKLLLSAKKGLVISEASRNTRYRMGSVVKTAVRNLLTNCRLTDYLRDLKIPYRQAHTTRSLVGSLCLTE